eukprot:1951634-Prymnesium_polylepis.1
MHKLLYHVLEQLLELRSCGMLHEGVVEAVHVVDNRMVLRFGCVRNLEQQVKCRLRAIWIRVVRRALMSGSRRSRM